MHGTWDGDGDGVVVLSLGS